MPVVPATRCGRLPAVEGEADLDSVVSGDGRLRRESQALLLRHGVETGVRCEEGRVRVR